MHRTNLLTLRWCSRSDWGDDRHGEFFANKTTNTLVMCNSDQITDQLPYLQYLKSLVLSWRSFECIANSISAAIDDCFDYDLNLLDGFLTIWDVAMRQSRAQ
jgi:hypothetical protein